MNQLLKNNKVLFAIIAVILCIGILVVKGPTFGVDFGGGTLFQIHLAEKVTDTAEKEQIRSIIQQRLDFSGTKDSTVQFVGNEFVFAQLAETDPLQVEKLESVLLKQGKFEAVLDGNTIFSGNDFVDISKDPAKGYGVTPSGKFSTWTLPFTLTEQASQKFSQMTFHRCTRTGFDSATGKVTYECDNTFFFLDRPSDSVLIIPKDIYSKDSDKLAAGIQSRNIPAGLKIQEILLNANMPNFILDSNGFSKEQIAQLQSLVQQRKFAIIPSLNDAALKKQLEEIGFTVNEVVTPSDLPFTWFATGLKEVIKLSEDVTNMDVSSLNDPNAKVYSSLLIRGSSGTNADARAELQSLSILLESGSLPVAVDNVSKVTVTAALGKSFLWTVALIGIIAAISVACVLFFRYRVIALVIPMMLTVFAEAILTLGISALFSWPLDLAAIAGIIAAIGYGVDDQIVITDELKKSKGEEEVIGMSLVNRAKRAFFIVIASAATLIAVMLPLLVVGPSSGMARLVGFAFTTIIGVLVGVLITRPAFQEIAKAVIHKAK
ncbi:MAG: hypothetical protein Q7R70_03560 [Candidatus Diapherotrites archaeon]|nr:hypothetical protein [Candidatus Diapherotrites archaeon]